jgi:hypothetical protein
VKESQLWRIAVPASRLCDFIEENKMILTAECQSLSPRLLELNDMLREAFRELGAFTQQERKP